MSSAEWGRPEPDNSLPGWTKIADRMWTRGPWTLTGEVGGQGQPVQYTLARRRETCYIAGVAVAVYNEVVEVSPHRDRLAQRAKTEGV